MAPREDAPVPTSTNLFAALDKKKKKKAKEETPKRKKKDRTDLLDERLWAQSGAGLNVGNWADADDDDDDFVPLGALPGDWEEAKKVANEEETLADEDELEMEDEEEENDMVKDEAEDGEDAEEVGYDNIGAQAAVDLKLKTPANEPEKQLSKKELKKKELEDLDAVFAEFGIDNAKEGASDISAGESKAAAKRRKRAEREAAEAAAKSVDREVNTLKKELQLAGQDEEEIAKGNEIGVVDPEAAKKKLVQLKAQLVAKKKSVGASASAAAEARKRAEKEKKGKRDKSNYNQAPK